MMCAGITTFNSLRHSGAKAGDIVAVLGVGGLGHLAVQFAAKMGFKTVAIARRKNKEPLARQLGAVHYIDSQAQDPAAELIKLGGATVILATATSSKPMAAVLPGLGIGGTRPESAHKTAPRFNFAFSRCSRAPTTPTHRSISGWR
jgi:D-arabinose 1-dehydrogenase-like Zn-dependent alcohol dehydrogenase